MSFLGLGKKNKEDDLNWKKYIVETYKEVSKHKEKFENLTYKYEEGKKTLKDHCDKEEKDREASAKDWIELKEHICKKIEDAECPEKQVIAEIKKNGLDKTGEIKELTDTVTRHNTLVAEYVNLAEGEKKAWKKIRIRTGYGFGIVSAITGIVTKIVGLW